MKYYVCVYPKKHHSGMLFAELERGQPAPFGGLRVMFTKYFTKRRDTWIPMDLSQERDIVKLDGSRYFVEVLSEHAAFERFMSIFI